MLAQGAGEDGAALKRTIIAFYNPNGVPVRETPQHRFVEMPLNHLGLVVEHHPLDGVPPALSDRPDIRGALLWLSQEGQEPGTAVRQWLGRLIAEGGRFVHVGSLPLFDEHADGAEGMVAAYAAAGVALDDLPLLGGLGAEVDHADPGFIGFERQPGPVLPFVAPVTAVAGARELLRLRDLSDPDRAIAAITLGSAGGYIGRGYAVFDGADPDLTQWIVDPFSYFAAAFATDELPKPDTTTLAGRRIYYSHIDGDGWRNISLVDEYLAERMMSARVILEEAIRPYPDLPVTVAPISADLDPAWYGSPEAREIARQILALPQVEAGSHTHSHPYYWKFFEQYSADAEARLLPRYRRLNGSAGPGWAGYGLSDRATPDARALSGYTVPRAYAVEPFDLALEIDGSIALIEQLLPPGKRVKVLQWSGDTTPWAGAIAAVDAAGVENINGGDSRFDDEFPSYAFVAPVGFREGDRWQVYASNSNENTYTDNWRSTYFGFRFLPQTLERTESPRRVRAANIYYHMYSGERVAALKALLDNLAWVRRHEVIPVETSAYAAIGRGFFTARIVPAGRLRWRVLARGALQTIRFDLDQLESLGLDRQAGIDWQRSTGVIGQRRHQGSLYVALDPATEPAVVALSPAAAPGTAPLSLVHSRWRPEQVIRARGGARFLARGYGAGAMTWRGVPGAAYRVQATVDGRMPPPHNIVADADGRLDFTLAEAARRTVAVSITRTAAEGTTP